MHVLLVDYSLISSVNLQELIEQSSGDTDVINCFSAGTLLNVAEKIAPDVIIVDLDLIEADIPGFFKTLRKKSGESRLVALAGSDYYQQLSTAIDSGGIDEYIVKPIRSEDFMARINIAARRKKTDAGELSPSTPEKEDGYRIETDDTSSPEALEDYFAHELLEKDQEKETARFDTGFTEEIESDYKLFEPSDEDDQFSSEGFDLVEPDAQPDLEAKRQSPEEDYFAGDDLPLDGKPDGFREDDPEKQPHPAEDTKPAEEETDIFDFDDIVPESGAHERSDQDVFAESPETDHGLFDETPAAESKETFVDEFDDIFDQQPPADLQDQRQPGPEEDRVKSFEEMMTSEPENGSLEDYLDQGPVKPGPGPATLRPADEFLEKPPSADDSKPFSSAPDRKDEDYHDFFDDNLYPDGQTGREEPRDLPGDARTEAGSSGTKIASSLPGNSADEFLFGEERGPKASYRQDGPGDAAGADEQVKPRSEGKKHRSSGGILPRAASIIANVFFVLLLLFMVGVSFFLIQDRITGEAPQVAGYQMHIILSDRMSPEIESGSLAFARQVEAEQIVVGDIIIFRSPDDAETLITNRVVGINRDEQLQFVTGSDAHELEDPGPVPAENVVGRVSGSVSYIGYLLDYAQTTQGLILLIFVPGILIIVYEVSKIIKYMTEGEGGRKGKKSKKHNRLAEE